MYVCLCKTVTDHQIRNLVQEGARSWRDVREQTGCATQCGKCACMAKAITHNAIKETMIQSAERLAYAI